MKMQPEEQDQLLVENTLELVQLNGLQKLPYLKHIEIMKFTPRHFGLEDWTRLFVIPDHLMRKIYRNDIWKDTELQGENSCENVTSEQKRALHEWLKLDSPFRDNLKTPPVEERQTRTRFFEDDDLKNLLDESDEWGHLDEKVRGVVDSKIAVCSGHFVQPENHIVKKAIEKMDHLSEQEEQHFQTLLRDTEYMGFLDETIKKYIENQN